MRWLYRWIRIDWSGLGWPDNGCFARMAVAHDPGRLCSWPFCIRCSAVWAGWYGHDWWRARGSDGWWWDRYGEAKRYLAVLPDPYRPIDRARALFALADRLRR